MKKKIHNIILAIALSGLALSANAALPSYTFTDLGTLGGTYSYANAINNAGQIVGSSETVGDVGQHATLWSSTNATDLGTLGGTQSSAYAINNVGQVAGGGPIPLAILQITPLFGTAPQPQILE